MEEKRFPQKFWDWYALGQGRLCTVDGHGQLSDHSVKELAICAVKKGIIDWADVPDEFKPNDFKLEGQ
jgi:hypothetical protein